MAGSPPPASPGGALSREQLYAPLTDYLPGGAPLGGAPAASASAASTSAASASAASASAAAASALRIHPSVRESALAEHLAAVSAAYVSDPALGGAGTRGNGGTSVDRRAMASRIRQRSLQLVGGGLLTGTAAAADVVDWGRSPEPGANFSPPGPGGAVGASRRSRRRRRAERGNRPYGSCSGTRRRRREEELLRGGKGGTGPPLDGPADTAALLALNGMWCQYVRSLLGLGGGGGGGGGGGERRHREGDGRGAAPAGGGPGVPVSPHPVPPLGGAGRGRGDRLLRPHRPLRRGPLVRGRGGSRRFRFQERLEGRRGPACGRRKHRRWKKEEWRWRRRRGVIVCSVRFSIRAADPVEGARRPQERFGAGLPHRRPGAEGWRWRPWRRRERGKPPDVVVRVDEAADGVRARGHRCKIESILIIMQKSLLLPEVLLLLGGLLLGRGRCGLLLSPPTEHPHELPHHVGILVLVALVGVREA